MSKLSRYVASFLMGLAKKVLSKILSPEQKIRLRRYLRDNLFGVERSALQPMVAGTNFSAKSLDRVSAPLTMVRSNVESLMVGELKEEIARISDAILPNLQKPFVMLEDGVSLESVIRTAFQVPSPQHFMLGEVELHFPKFNSSDGVVRNYIDSRCPRIGEPLRNKLSARFVKLLSDQNVRRNSEALLKFAPGEGISRYQFDWYMAHMASACNEEQEKVRQWIELSLEDESQYLCSLFLAFNFDSIVVARLSYLLNGYRYSQIGLPSPFVYMMV